MLADNLNDINGLMKGYALACAFLLDHSNDFDKLAKTLEFLYHHIIDMKEIDISIKALITHLFGIVTKVNPKTKGEGLALIEISKKLKSKIYNIEKVSLLRVSDYKYDTDYDQQTLNYISKNKQI
jgi:hypothetical protein